MTPERQADLLLRLELMEVQDRYIAAIDDDKLEEWPEFFIDDCLYEIIPRENEDQGLPAPLIYCDSRAMLRDRVVSLRHANVYEKPAYRHMISGFRVVSVTGDEVETQSSYIIVNTSQAGVSSIFQAGRYEDTLICTDAGWRFKRKRAIYDTSRVQTLLAFPV